MSLSSMSGGEPDETMMTSFGWCDTGMQYEVLQVLFAMLKGSVTAKDILGIIPKLVCKLARPCYLGRFAICKLLFGVARCAGY